MLLPALRLELRPDLVIINGENASHGFGLGPDMAVAMFEAGADVVTLGNHAWDRRELIPFIAQEKRVIRPLNFPVGTPGAGSVEVSLADGRRALVVNAMGRLFMDPMDDPFRATAELLARYKLGASVQAIVIDFHSEATSEKLAFAHSFDGTVSFVVGTHTHVPTSDHQILAAGPRSRRTPACAAITTASSAWPSRGPPPGSGPRCPANVCSPPMARPPLCGTLVVTDDKTGLATGIEPLRRGGRLSQATPLL